jgi:hypothetical protein
VSDTQQIDRIYFPVSGKELEIVPPAEAVAHEPVDEDYGRQRTRIGSGEVEIAHPMAAAWEP